MFSLLAIATWSALAADPCKGVKIRSIDDPFTGQAKAGSVLLDTFGWNQIALVKNAEGMGIQAVVVMGQLADWKGSVGDPIELAIGDGQILTIPMTSESLPIAGATDTSVFTKWMVQGMFDADSLARLTAGTPSALKVTLGSNFLQLAISPKDGEKIAAIAACLAAS
jgi:hypothetical protein